jgi:hypothetical protein
MQIPQSIYSDWLELFCWWYWILLEYTTCCTSQYLFGILKSKTIGNIGITSNRTGYGFYSGFNFFLFFFPYPLVSPHPKVISTPIFEFLSLDEVEF